MSFPQPITESAPVTLLEVNHLQPAEFLKTLFPAGRDWPLLRASFTRHGYQAAFPVVVRPRLGGKGLEIVDGVGRVTLARDAGIKKITALVKAMEEEEARRYAVDSNLYRANTQAAIKLVPAIVLALEHQRSGGEYRVERILELTGVSRATYKRAMASINFVIETLRETHTKLESRTEAEVVADCLHDQLWPGFSQFYLGEIEPYVFYKRVYCESPKAKARRKKKPQGQAEETQLCEGIVAPEMDSKNAGRALDAGQEAVACLNSFLEMAKANRFIRQISEHPEMLHILDARVQDLESIVPYLEELTAHLKGRRQERRAELKKTRLKDQRQINLV